ncbi:hypothetical protein BC936DRAFT_143737 [Jimgerdemannia flammicorona]|uniref:Uncharacterized protein n=1 Tax=Jimgerdemannia flammicorona TaxID=994334 RepID=A0A432ZZ11_9FUNG|nr:hypothetical protein BC936DRAFT_143737 [Jimgerdemannia flammicorona]
MLSPEHHVRGGGARPGRVRRLQVRRHRRGRACRAKHGAALARVGRIYIRRAEHRVLLGEFLVLDSSYSWVARCMHTYIPKTCPITLQALTLNALNPTAALPSLRGPA